MRETVEDFWTNYDIYPSQDLIKKRRWYEVRYLMRHLHKYKTLKDIGCGSGDLISILTKITDLEITGYDLVPRKKRNIQYYNCYEPTELPKTDVTILGGLIQYLDDESLNNFLKYLKKDKVIFIRTATNEKTLVVNGFSDDLGRDYASIYRSYKDTCKILEKHFKIVEVEPIYPPELESKYGTVQYYFKCTT